MVIAPRGRDDRAPRWRGLCCDFGHAAGYQALQVA